MSKINFHYAYQLCDTQSLQGQPRICGDDRTLLSKKSVKSFLESLVILRKNFPHTKHTVCFFNDRSTNELIKYIYDNMKIYEAEDINLIFQNNIDIGILNSIKQCYMWLQENGTGMVYQIQDDYIFFPDALKEMYAVSNQIKYETGYDIVVSPFNDFHTWLTVYRNSSTPRTVVVGENRYWIQYYDMSCSFMTTHLEFSKHWDLYNAFFDLLAKKDPRLEAESLNYMLTSRVVGLIPINSLAFHMQSELEKDPHIDWKPLWDSIDVTSPTI